MEPILPKAHLTLLYLRQRVLLLVLLLTATVTDYLLRSHLARILLCCSC